MKFFLEKHTKDSFFYINIKKEIYTTISKYQKINFFDTKDFGRVFTLDGIIMSTEKDEFIYHEMITHVAMAVNPKIKKVLVIGGGDGGTVRELVKYKNILFINMVEIDELVVDLCKKYFKKTSSKLNDKRVNIFFKNAINFIKKDPIKYDLIIIDSTDPIGPGKDLFSEEFYKNCFDRLNENGIMINQHESPYYKKDRKMVIDIHNNIKKIFPIAKIYQFHMPTYPSGHWLFGFSSKKLDPIKNIKKKEW